MVRAKPSVTKTFGAHSGRLRAALVSVAAWVLLAMPATGLEMGSGVIARANYARPHFRQVKPQPAGNGIDRLRQWMNLAREHTPGTVDEPVRQVRSYYLSTLVELQNDFEAYLEFWKDSGLNRRGKGGPTPASNRRSFRHWRLPKPRTAPETCCSGRLPCCTPTPWS